MDYTKKDITDSFDRILQDQEHFNTGEAIANEIVISIINRLPIVQMRNGRKCFKLFCQRHVNDTEMETVNKILLPYDLILTQVNRAVNQLTGDLRSDWFIYILQHE